MSATGPKWSRTRLARVTETVRVYHLLILTTETQPLAVDVISI
ncbi:hypothetical protein IMCC20628_01086 [Hoeflea sp. IMCC20628]|nr:hypothetical protein IMCC20628_01086 [Hoeflea sp. IMCC20628]